MLDTSGCGTGSGDDRWRMKPRQEIDGRLEDASYSMKDERFELSRLKRRQMTCDGDEDEEQRMAGAVGVGSWKMEDGGWK